MHPWLSYFLDIGVVPPPLRVGVFEFFLFFSSLVLPSPPPSSRRLLFWKGPLPNRGIYQLMTSDSFVSFQTRSPLAGSHVYFRRTGGDPGLSFSSLCPLRVLICHLQLASFPRLFRDLQSTVGWVILLFTFPVTGTSEVFFFRSRTSGECCYGPPFPDV